MTQGWGGACVLCWLRGQLRESYYLNKLFIFHLHKASPCSVSLARQPRLGFLWPSSKHTVNFHIGSSSSLLLPLGLSLPCPHLPAGRGVCVCVCVCVCPGLSEKDVGVRGHLGKEMWGVVSV